MNVEEKLYYCPMRHRLTTCCHVLAECTERSADPAEEEARYRFCPCYESEFAPREGRSF